MIIKTIKDGKIEEDKITLSKSPVNIPNIYIKKLDSNNILLIDSLNDYIDIIPEKLVNIDNKTCLILDRYSDVNSTEGIDKIKKRYKSNIRNYLQNDKIYSYAICLTYSCNFKCTYCFERDNLKKFKTISKSDLYDMLNLIKSEITEIRNINSDSVIYMELFGGEPLLTRNRELLKIIFEFARENNLYISITSNGYEVISLIEELICYRDVIACFCITIDGTREYHDKRRIINDKIGTFDKIVEGVQLLLELDFKVVCATNVDKKNIDNLESLFNFYKTKSWLDYNNFSVQIGRVDDKFNSGNKDLLTEAKLLNRISEIFKDNKPDWLSTAFLKSIERPSNILDVGYNQIEYGKIPYNHCWATSPIIKGCYIGPDLELYRCTVSVSNENYKVGNLRSDSSYSCYDSWLQNNIFSRKECLDCNISGYCGGGCKIEKDTYGYEYICNYNKSNFEEFIQCIALDKINKLLRDYDEKNI